MQSKTRGKTLIPKAWIIPEVFRSRVGADVGRQRLMHEEGQLLVVLHSVPRAEDKGYREGALFWVDEVKNWKSFPRSGGRSALRELVESYRRRIGDLDIELDNKSTAEGIHEVIDEAAPVLRAARHMLSVISELRKELTDDREVLAIRDLAISIERGADLLVQDAKTSLDFLIARSAAEQAAEAASATKEAKKLNRLAAFFFPLMTLASVFGMNRPGDMTDSGGVWFVVFLGLIMGVVVSNILRK